MTVNSRLTATLTVTQTGSTPTTDLASSAAAGTVTFGSTADQRLTDGTTAGKADVVFSDRRTLTASATENLDLAGVLTDAYGATVTFARIKSIEVVAAAGNTNQVVLGAAGSNPWATLLNATGTLSLNKGGFFAAGCGDADATGWAVTAGTGDILKVANSGGTTGVTYDITIVCCSV